jgi:hypothetical protein
VGQRVLLVVSDSVSRVNPRVNSLRFFPVRERGLLCNSSVFQRFSEVDGGVNGVDRPKLPCLDICRSGVTGVSQMILPGNGDGGEEIELDGDTTIGVPGVSTGETGVCDLDCVTTSFF